MEIEKRIEKWTDDSYTEIYHKKDDVHCCHREDGPAYIYYNKDDSIEYEQYRINDKFHREDGPALIEYNKDGSIKCEEYWINGKSLSKKEWEKEYGWKLQLKGTPMGKIFLT